MGRKRKYNTEEERRDAQRKWQMEHYQRNKDKILKKARDNYKKKKRETRRNSMGKKTQGVKRIQRWSYKSCP